MWKLATFGLLALLLAGCGRSQVPAAAVGAEPVPQLVPAQSPQGLAEIGGSVYEGQTAEQWAAQLADPNPVVRKQASQVLGAMSKHGTGYLLQGMRSNSPETQVNCLQAIYKPDLVARSKETLPLVSGMLDHRDPQVRLNAVARMPWFGAEARGAMPTLQYLAANDPSPEVRSAAREAQVHINYAVTGVMPKHGH